MAATTSLAECNLPCLKADGLMPQNNVVEALYCEGKGAQLRGSLQVSPEPGVALQNLGYHSA